MKPFFNARGNLMIGARSVYISNSGDLILMYIVPLLWIGVSSVSFSVLGVLGYIGHIPLYWSKSLHQVEACLIFICTLLGCQ